MTQNQQRFSGRELSELLSQVREELGERATIIEANRLREGGIGGFFSKERFEVVATADGGDGTVAPAGLPHVEGLLSRAEQVSGDERRVAGASTSTAPPGPAQVEERDVTDACFDEILRGALSDLDAPPLAPAAELVPPAAELVPPAAEPVPPTAEPTPVVPAQESVRPADITQPAAAPRCRSVVPGGAFWEDLARFEQLVDEAPLAAELTTVVGSLEDAVAVARHVARLHGVEQGDLVVMTEERSVDGIPPWQVVDRREDLAERVRYWRANRRRAVVVVDLEDGERGLERGARSVEVAAADVTRLAVPDLDDLGGLARTLRGLGPVAAIDVSRPPAPERLVDVVERGVRIGTVCGRPLTPVLLAGLTATIAARHG